MWGAGFWYIYRRGETTPAYSHIGLDTSATLNNQKHVGNRIKELIDLSIEQDNSGVAFAKPVAKQKSGFFKKLFG